MLKLLFRLVKWLLTLALGILLLGAIVVFAFVKLSPEIGGSHSDEDIARYEASGHYEDGIFMNLEPTFMMEMTWDNITETLNEFMKDSPNRKPSKELPLHKVNKEELQNKNNKLIWFGHSAFLLQLDGKNILLDPMLGESPAPHPAVGTKRYSKELPMSIAELPQIDAIILSHDHYDHLDYGSIMELKEKTREYFVPLGVGAHLREWGIADSNIHELNWWDEIAFENIQLAFAPSRHFSGRSIIDNAATLWGSWVIKGQSKNIYFSGDGGYGSHFKEIGNKYGPFDFAMLECGQYNERWEQIHMMPEQTAQAAVDIKTNVMMPIHWAAFTLSLHDWNEPVIRVTKKAGELNMPITVPIIGASVNLDGLSLAQEKWWLQN